MWDTRLLHSCSLRKKKKKEDLPIFFFFHRASEDHVIQNPTEGGFLFPFSFFSFFGLKHNPKH